MIVTSSEALEDDINETPDFTVGATSTALLHGSADPNLAHAKKPKGCWERWRRAPCDVCAPGLYQDQDIREILQDQCALVLVTSQGTGWDAEWQPSEERRRRLQRKLFDQMDQEGIADGIISFEEFTKFCEKQKDEFKALPKRMHGWRNKDVREKAFKHFDENESMIGTAGLDRREFDRFMLYLESCYMEYLLRCAHLAYRAFWGRGLELQDQSSDSGRSPHDDTADLLGCAAGRVNAKAWRAFRKRQLQEGSSQSRSLSSRSGSQSEGFAAPAVEVSATDLDDDNDDDDKEVGRCWVRCGNLFVGVDKDIPPNRWTIFPPGWWADLWYYSANNHPLHGIFMCDVAHPLDWKERVMMELSAIGISLYSLFVQDELGNEAQKLHDRYRLGGGQKFLTIQAYSLLYVTLPGVAIWYCLFSLYTCPCGNIEEAEATLEEIRIAKWKRRVGESIAYSVMFLSLVGVLYMYGWSRLIGNSDHEKRDSDMDDELWLLWYAFKARLKGYVISWCLMLFVYFNPLVAWGNPNALAELTVLEKLADLVAIGQWRIEKLRFQSLCRHALDARVTTSRSQS